MLSEEGVLKLNSNWIPVSSCSVKEAITDLCSIDPITFKYKFQGLDIEYDGDEVSSIKPYFWNEWINLPVRENDHVIHSINLAIRIPTIIVCSNYSRMPTKKLKPTWENIAKRDNWECQYSGVKLDKDTATIDHIIPKYRGGSECWSNKVLCHKSINSKKGHKLNEEIGLKLKSKPKPLISQIPLISSINKIKHKDWSIFLKDFVDL
jgi:5-methylcytosine-specific restriction endonuclease McrA